MNDPLQYFSNLKPQVAHKNDYNIHILCANLEHNSWKVSESWNYLDVVHNNTDSQLSRIYKHEHTNCTLIFHFQPFDIFFLPLKIYNYPATNCSSIKFNRWMNQVSSDRSNVNKRKPGGASVQDFLVKVHLFSNLQYSK